MSVDYNTFVGPYLEVHNPLRNSTEEYHTCSNKKCKNHAKPISDKFCSKCGGKIKLERFPCQNRIEFDINVISEDLSEAMIEYNYNGDNMYFYYSDYGSSFDGNDCIAKEIDINDPVKKLYEFQLKFKSEIEQIQNIFGKDNVKVKWGVFVWCH
jgi:hypothetical protein